MTAADPDFRAAEEIRRAIANMAVDGVFSYGREGGVGHIRIVYSTSMGIMEEAMDRIEVALIKL